MLLFLLHLVHSLTITATTCSSQYLQLSTFTCQTCSANQVYYNSDCYCPSSGVGNFPSVSSCSSSCACQNQFNDDGQYTGCSNPSCTCSGKAIYNGQTCIPCPGSLVQVTTTSCGCLTTVKAGNYCVSSLSAGCASQNPQVCNVFANSCVDAMISSIVSTNVYNGCSGYTSSTYAPQLYPNSTITSSQQLIESSVNLQLTFNAKEASGGAVNKIPIYIVDISADGSVSQFRPLTNELMLCSNSLVDGQWSQRFTVRFEQDCQINTALLDVSTTVYHQLFLLDSDGTYYQIPIYMTNQGPTQLDERHYSSFTLSNFVYRFKLYDSTSLAQYVTFQYNLKSNSGIYLPYVTIQYKAYSTNTTVTGVHYGEYYWSTTTFYSVALGLLIVTILLAIVVWVVRLWVWSKSNPAYMAEQMWGVLFCIKGFYCLLDTIAEALFYFIFFMTGYWFCFFKFQSDVLVLMPEISRDYASNYAIFEALFYIMFSLRMLTTIHLVLQQADLEIFFIDWEKTEIMQPKDLHQHLDPSQRQIVEKYVSRTSAWRQLLIANEFNELSTYRMVSTEWTMFFIGFFLEGLKWHNLQSDQANVDVHYVVGKNYLLGFFLNIFLYLIIGLAQIILQKLFDRWFPICIEDFVDLCAVSNISILIIDDLLHGYYIHGENPIGYAEGSNEHLATCLHYEANGKGKKRGYIQEETSKEDHELQTFEIFLPQRFRESYDRCFKVPLRTGTDNAQGDYNEIQILRNPLPSRLVMEEVELNRQKIQFYIKDVLTQVRNNHTKYIRDKFGMQRFLSYPPSDLEDYRFKDQSLPIFYRDPDYSFKNIFFCGHEFFFLVTDTMMFAFWMLQTDNTYVALLLTYLFTQALFRYRQWVGERNLSDKTKINQRFLI